MSKQNRLRLSPWQIAAGLLLYALLGAGLGIASGVAVLLIRSIVDPPLRIPAVLLALSLIVVSYGRWVWIPILSHRRRK